MCFLIGLLFQMLAGYSTLSIELLCNPAVKTVAVLGNNTAKGDAVKKR